MSVILFLQYSLWLNSCGNFFQHNHILTIGLCSLLSLMPYFEENNKLSHLFDKPIYKIITLFDFVNTTKIVPNT